MFTSYVDPSILFKVIGGYICGCSSRIQLDIISLMVNLSCESGQLMARYEFLGAMRMFICNVRTDSNLI